MRVIHHLLRRLHREERGSVVLVVVAFLPVAFALAAFVIDVANGAEHRRHLQLQADAGALAAAQEFNGCFLDPAGAKADIEAEALAYSGATYNAQIGSADAQDRVAPRINAATWEADSYSAGDPCETGYVDVKLIEEDSPPFFPFVGNHDFRAHARVQIFKLASSNRLLPIAVPDPDPKLAVARFIDEGTGAVLASTPLTKNGNQDGMVTWDNSTVPVTVPITAEHVGVQIALGGGTSTTCGEPLVSCYDAGSSDGIVHIRGWTAAGTATPQTPLARSVTLLPGSLGNPGDPGPCPDAYFSNAATTCTINVDATVDFGASPTALGATVEATVADQSYPLTFNAATGTWSTAASIPVTTQAGPLDVGLHWTIARNADGTNCNGGRCRGDIAAVHRHFAAMPDRSGPIGLAQVSEGGVMTNSFERCSALLTTCSHDLVVKIGVLGGLELSTSGGPPVRLRVIGGSQNQSLDCDPDVANLMDELATGCKPSYTPHDDASPPCPNSTGELWADPNPPAVWDCVAVQTGNATNQIAAGLNERILGSANPSTCTHPNNWPDWEPGDSRIIFVIVTPFGAFGGSGSTTVPVVRFAAFYVTGWTGQGGGFSNPCLAEGDEAPTNSAEIVGRFIQYVDTPNEGGAEETSCDFSAIDPCIAVMVE
jgi:Flp pilus assembly protein TadG